ncbi:MAG: outer membrane lipoprotein-sorting protein [Candidatus Latescibacteria bacterium]|nr:outer membrane lipoprotein-sorting protein [bacterium]MBD3424949.1 outer membrane lipoprotein-sorting protein [Candidatus Latescibacterota bacterium]
MRKLLVAVASLLVMAAAAPASESDVDRVIEKLDRLYRSSSSTGSMKMTIINPHWERSLVMDFWSEGMDRMLIVVTEPEKEKGTATLKIDNEMWNYIPNINKVVKIPPSMMMANWMGSDFTNDDIVRESSFISDYHYSEINPPEAEEGMMYLELVPKEGVVTLWKKLVMKVDRENLLPVEQRYVDEKERVMKKMLYDRVKVMDGKEIPTRMTMVPLSEEKKGHRTTVEYLDIEFEVELDDDLFSLRNLRKRR